MNTQKSWFNAFFAWIHQEVDASVLEAYQRAGNMVFDLMLEAEVRREQEITPWTTPIHQQLQNVCLWNALVLQTLGDQLLQTDYRLNPRTAGYVPPLTAKQIELFYQPVEAWLSRADQAKENRQYSLADIGLALPAALPTWLTLKEMLDKKLSHQQVTRYLDGLLTAAKTLVLHIDTQMKPFEQDVDPDRKVIINQLNQLRAHVGMTLEYVIQLWGGELHAGLHDKIEQGIRRIVNDVALLGQLLAMPSLVDKINIQQWAQVTKTTETLPPKLLVIAQQAAAPVNSMASLATNDHLWSLSAELVRKQKQQDAYAISLLTTMWKNDPQPQLALHIQNIIQQALAKGYIAYATHQQLPYFKQSPWSAIYITKRPIVIAGDPLRVHQLFTYVCDADRADNTEPRGFGNRILRL